MFILTNVHLCFITLHYTVLFFWITHTYNIINHHVIFFLQILTCTHLHTWPQCWLWACEKCVCFLLIKYVSIWKQPPAVNSTNVCPWGSRQAVLFLVISRVTNNSFKAPPISFTGNPVLLIWSDFYGIQRTPHLRNTKVLLLKTLCVYSFELEKTPCLSYLGKLCKKVTLPVKTQLSVIFYIKSSSSFEYTGGEPMFCFHACAFCVWIYFLFSSYFTTGYFQVSKQCS